MEKDIQKSLQKINDRARYNSTASLNSLIDEVIDVFGGVREVAKAMHISYVSSKPGSSGQTRVLDGIIRMMLRRDGDETQYEDLNAYDAQQLEGMLAQELNVDVEKVQSLSPEARAKEEGKIRIENERKALQELEGMLAEELNVDVEKVQSAAPDAAGPGKEDSGTADSVS